MKLSQLSFCTLLLSLTFAVIRTEVQTDLKRNNLFDFNWRFHAGGTRGAEEPSYDDSKWRKINLPHNWSIEDLPGKIAIRDTFRGLHTATLEIESN